MSECEDSGHTSLVERGILKCSLVLVHCNTFNYDSDREFRLCEINRIKIKTRTLVKRVCKSVVVSRRLTSGSLSMCSRCYVWIIIRTRVILTHLDIRDIAWNRGFLK